MENETDIKNKNIKEKESRERTGGNLDIAEKGIKGTLVSSNRKSERKPSSAEWQRVLETLRKLKLLIDT